MVESDKHYQDVRDFHQVMDGRVPQKPVAFTIEQVVNRADFKIEEIVELVYATSQSEEAFDESIAYLHDALYNAAQKTKMKGKQGNSTLVGQVDALIDLLYFTYGSFALIGVDPGPIFEIVHRANMGKIWPDGKAHYHPKTGKILKPDHWERDFAPEARIAQEIDRQESKAHQMSD
ncbi:putative HAD superfamily Cof-like phosphohydrolase [Streptococcus moroccensis]|uniref:HAD superfamily Cof-like phosphohydrolase n=1 Tax=Streptococcus moroccensis TaxID=1451356 RepID=A0ABT9YS05_9STRE|nr:putative HAD superfamily Cof-like phosphohydrolase [Streptococcus moroccensis]